MTRNRNEAAPPMGSDNTAPRRRPRIHNPAATATPMIPPRRRIARRVATTPPGSTALRDAAGEEARDDGTSPSYDSRAQRTGHRWSLSVRLSLCALVLWGCLLASEDRVWSRARQPIVGACEGVAELKTDPRRVMNGTSVVLALQGVRYQVNAYGQPSWMLQRRLAGERVWVAGTCGEFTGRFSRSARISHIVGRLNVSDVSEEFSDGSLMSRAANRMRRTMIRGVSAMSPDTRALFTGLVIGDDREQPREMILNFRTSGLSHLTAVSGQNVSYLLVVVSPVLHRLSKKWRFIATMFLLLWFVLLTRAEPSVVRAAFMAGVVAVNGFIGRPQNARAVLASTVIALLIVDPMLAWSVGFALSVGATGGLAWLSARIGAIVGGRGVVAATLAAQVGTAPISLLIFGSLPVVALVANPLVIGVAGMVMMAGVPLALLSGIVSPLVAPMSWLLSLPVMYVNTIATCAAFVSPSPWLNSVLWIVVLAVVWRRFRAHTRLRSLPSPTSVAG